MSLESILSGINERLAKLEANSRVVRLKGGGGSKTTRVKLHGVWWSNLGTKIYIRIRVKDNTVEDTDGPWPGEDPDGEIWLETASSYGDYVVPRL